MSERSARMAAPCGGPLLDLAPVDIVPQSGDEEGPGGNDLLPPAVVGVALVEDVGGTRLESETAADGDVARPWAR